MVEKIKPFYGFTPLRIMQVYLAMEMKIHLNDGLSCTRLDSRNKIITMK